MAELLILTLDAGTTGVKCAAFNQEGEARFSCVESYPTYFPFSGWAQQRPSEQLDAALRSIRRAVAEVGAAQIAALVFTGTMNGCIPVGEDGEALYDNIIHSDVRTQAQAAELCRRIPLEMFYKRTGNRIDVHSGLPKYMWLKEKEPDVYRRAWKFVNIKDYLYGHFTACHGQTDRSDASLCNCIDITGGDWAWDVLREVGIAAEKMPQLRSSTDVTGRLCRAYADLTGLPQGLPVAVGAGDGACAAHGARAHRPGAAYMNIGSSAWVSAMSTAPVLDRELRLFNYFDMDERCYNVCGTVQCGAAASNWAIENLIYPGTRVADCDFGALEALARSVPPGAQGVFFMPTLMGERTPWWTAKATGMLMGMTQYHGPGHIARAVYEGVMQALRMCGELLRENSLELPSLMLIGGGAKSELWGQMAASMFGSRIDIHLTPHEATSLGAAFAAGVGIGWYRNFEEAAAKLRVRRSYLPNAGEQEAYRRHYEVYRRLYPLTRQAHEEIFSYQQSLLCQGNSI